MLKKIFGSLFLAVITMQSLTAADWLPNQCWKPGECCSYDWSGMYVGVSGGYAWGNQHVHLDPRPTPVSFAALAPTTARSHPRGGFGGAQIGLNKQCGLFVYGLEADISGGSIQSRRSSPIVQNSGVVFPGGATRLRAHTDWFGTVRARIGFTPCCNILTFLSGGLLYGNVKHSSTVDFRPAGTTFYNTHFNKVHAGWTAGFGLEYGVCENWSFKVEYLYLDFGHHRRTANPTPANPPFVIHNRFETTANLVRLGINYKFGCNSFNY